MAAKDSNPKIRTFGKVGMYLWEVTEYVGETLVFLGVIGEVYADWANHDRKRLEKLSSIVLIIGLSISLAALVGTNENFNGTIADLSIQAARFNKAAADANVRAGAAEVEAAQLRLQAEELEEKNLEQGSRDLLLYGKRAEDFTNALRPFKGQKVEIRRCLFNDNEARDTANRLTVLFGEAGWAVSPGSPDWGESNCMIIEHNAALPSGLWVGTPNAKPTLRARDRARKLIQIFGRIPLYAELHTIRVETARATEDNRSFLEEYDNPDAVVVSVMAHPSKTPSDPITPQSTEH